MEYKIKTNKDELITTDEDDMRNFINEALDNLESGEIYYINIIAKKKNSFTPDKNFWEN